MQELTVRTPHGKVAVIDFGGDGNDVVLLHGAGRHAWDWALVLPHLRGLRSVGVEFRWHGLSSDEGDVSLEANADDVEAVIEQLGLRNPVIAGHSLGGMTAAVYGTRHPECPGVINIDGHGRGTREEYAWLSNAEFEQFQRTLHEGFLAQLPSDSGDDAWRQAQIDFGRKYAARNGWSFPAEAVEAGDHRGFFKDEAGTWHRRPSTAYTTRIPELASVNMLDIYRRCEAPLLIYWCTRPAPPIDPGIDEILEARQRWLRRELDELAAGKPSFRVEPLDSSHAALWDQPELVARGIAAFAR